MEVSGGIDNENTVPVRDFIQALGIRPIAFHIGKGVDRKVEYPNSPGTRFLYRVVHFLKKRGL